MVSIVARMVKLPQSLTRLAADGLSPMRNTFWPIAANTGSASSGRRWPRMRNMPRCSICTDFMVAPEASVLKTDGEVSYLWSCDMRGLGFVPEVRLPAFERQCDEGDYRKTPSGWRSRRGGHS